MSPRIPNWRENNSGGSTHPIEKNFGERVGDKKSTPAAAPTQPDRKPAENRQIEGASGGGGGGGGFPAAGNPVLPGGGGGEDMKMVGNATAKKLANEAMDKNRRASEEL